jgi:hypothetical protein
MSSLKPKSKRERTIDVTACVLSATIVVLATLDLLVWALMRNVPNPISKFIGESISWVAPASAKHIAR